MVSSVMREPFKAIKSSSVPDISEVVVRLSPIGPCIFCPSSGVTELENRVGVTDDALQPLSEVFPIGGSCEAFVAGDILETLTSGRTQQAVLMGQDEGTDLTIGQARSEMAGREPEAVEETKPPIGPMGEHLHAADSTEFRDERLKRPRIRRNRPMSLPTGLMVGGGNEPHSAFTS